MLISHKYKFIFIHIYKTAGTSITDEFIHSSRLVDRLAYEYMFSRKIYRKIINKMEWQNDGMKQFTGHHKHAKAYEIEMKLGSKIFDSYHKFTFVRNPFDLLVSLYFYILQDKKNPSHVKVSGMNFTEFVKWHLSLNPMHQIDFVMSPSRDRTLINYIGRFESLAENVATIKKHLKLEITDSIKHSNPSIKRKTKDYKDYYDNESRELVLNYFQADFQMLGYDFYGYKEIIPIMQEL